MNNQYLDIFLEEAKEHIQNLNENILLLKDSSNRSAVDEIFRSAHTLKGMAGTMGFNRISEITHEMENLLQEIRSNRVNATQDIIDTLLQCVDVIEMLINDIVENSAESEMSVQHILNMLRQKNNSLDTNEERSSNNFSPKQAFNEFEIGLAKEAFAQDYKLYEILVTLAEGCLLKSARAFVVFKTLEKFGEIIKTHPEVSDIEDEKFDLDFTLYIISKNTKDEIAISIKSISEIKDVEIIELDTSILEDFTNGESNYLGKDNSAKLSSNSAKSTYKKKVNKTLRVDISRLDKLMNLVSELIIIKTRLEDLDEKNDTKKKKETIEQLERVTSNLHDAVMKVRMVPIENIFNRFPRVVHDLSRELSKKINLRIEGQETELDRTIIDEIGDPLIHLIRNAADHGLESPSERISLGKDEEGNIKIKAYHDGNNVVIEVSDDGKGIDPDNILKRALRKGLVTDLQAEKLSDAEIIQFLFRPGFSTKDQVSDVSGRGVGLDVVKTKIETLGGSVEVESRRGCGTLFSIRLPLTLAIIQALMVQVGEEKYAIPLSSIKETVIISRETLKKVQKHEVILLRERVVPLLKLSEMLDIQTDVDSKQYMTVVIVKKGDRDVGLVVEKLIGQQEIVIKSLGNYLENIKFIAGATILGDGKVALILDVNTLI
ncbi:MAG: chemotaxis protein CheA [Thermoanaerobacterales bacterium]|nr:chemotaxis protein CheA [Thermoanaerobacterales bacterium]